jgi:acyl carrier protein
MANSEIEAIVLDLLAYYCELPRAEVRLDMRVQEDLGLDSIDAAAILVVLEDRIDREIAIEALEGLSTVGSIVSALAAMPGVAEAMATDFASQT